MPDADRKDTELQTPEARRKTYFGLMDWASSWFVIGVQEKLTFLSNSVEVNEAIIGAGFYRFSLSLRLPALFFYAQMAGLFRIRPKENCGRRFLI